jgi:hypothetical protein
MQALTEVTSHQSKRSAAIPVRVGFSDNIESVPSRTKKSSSVNGRSFRLCVSFGLAPSYEYARTCTPHLSSSSFPHDLSSLALS